MESEMNVKGDSDIPEVPAVFGENTAGGAGVKGHSENGRAIEGWSNTSYGVSGDSQKSAGVRGTSFDGRGTEGWSTNSEGVVGISTNSTGVWGQTEGAGIAVLGTSKHGDGVFGTGRRGVVGESDTFQGVYGHSRDNAGVVGESQQFHALFGISHGSNNGGVIGINDAGGFGVIGISDTNTGVAVHGRGGRLAGLFQGDVQITGRLDAPTSTITCFDVSISNADCAEDFNIGTDLSVDPGTVMVLGEEGALFPSLHAYDKRVAGVISGAGEYKPGIVLDKHKSDRNRQPVALLGKVFCKVDAQYGAIAVGDLLTTSPTPGHAMKATDQLQAFGAVIGKALRPLGEGQGLIPVLISLQ
jgi:hypothetical protein